MELQDPKLASTMRDQQRRASEFWEKNWVLSNFCMLFHTLLLWSIVPSFLTHAYLLNHIQHSGVPLKIKRLARDPNRFIWALSIAQSRCINMQMRIGALVQDANMLIPYAGKFFAPKFLFITLSNILYPIKQNLITSCVCLELSIVNLSTLWYTTRKY